jgi:hypothetical protein
VPCLCCRVQSAAVHVMMQLGLGNTAHRGTRLQGKTQVQPIQAALGTAVTRAITPSLTALGSCCLRCFIYTLYAFAVICFKSGARSYRHTVVVGILHTRDPVVRDRAQPIQPAMGRPRTWQCITTPPHARIKVSVHVLLGASLSSQQLVMPAECFDMLYDGRRRIRGSL